MRLILAMLILMAPLAGAFAQPAPVDNVSVEFSGKERAVFLAMCDDATWAARKQYDGVCEFFKTKFAAALKAAADKAETPKEKPNVDDAQKPESGSGSTDR